MTIGKTLIFVSAVILGASSMVFAEAGPNGNPSYNAAHSGGPGTHAGAMRSGSAANSQKVYKNQNGYRSGSQ
jgi:hypothetical protein